VLSDRAPLISHESPEIIELSDSDDEVIVLSSPSPAPARQPASPPVKPRGSLRDVPIDIDALEPDIIDLTDDSPARRNVSLFEELPLSPEPSVPQTAPVPTLPPPFTVSQAGDVPQPAPVQLSPPLSGVSEEEPPPSSPEPEVMDMDVGKGNADPTPSRTHTPAQDDDPLGPVEQTFSPIARIQTPIRVARESTPLINLFSPKHPSQQTVSTPCNPEKWQRG
jgi:hypothetical protein